MAKLRYYLLAETHQPIVRLLGKVEGDRWIEQILDREDRIEIACGDIRLTLSLDNLYEDTGLLTQG
ncbi:MAG: hypothetical protein KDJ22_02515 [Candidatus Competibacteraceae bacterium]|nr:hypothetical protein [Candidatus Competibacteraceae bacterium]MCP5127720.1 hypothetical protein [Gammaproteobacteria bacterium]HRX70870.1 hypothetical protein [Candidatus Competibacteraceae bacterium]